MSLPQKHRSSGPVTRALSRVLLDKVLAWRRRGALLGTYKTLPSWLRAIVSRVVWSGLWGSVKFPPLPVVRQAPAAALSGQDSGRPALLNMFGFFGGQFGLGESARLYASALSGAGVPVATIDIDLGLPHARQAVARGAKPNPKPGAVDLVVVNPDYLPKALPKVESLGLARRFRIGCWYWELGQVPAAWREAIADVDAIMVSSGFVEQAFAAVTDKPVFRVPLPLVQRPDSGLGREAFGLSGTSFVFLTSFDFHSSIYRKNPRDVIAAFAQAFPGGDEDVQLIVKSSNGAYYPAQLAELVETAASDPRILIRDQVIDALHMRSLQRCCDAYVSLHRAEGFGLGLAECMAMGKPVVATAWSGNLDYMHEGNSCLVGAVLVPVLPHEYPNAEGASWAQPDLIQAADWMRRLALEAGLAGRIGRQAALDVGDMLSPQRVAGQLIARVQEVLAGTGSAPADLAGEEQRE